MKTRSLLIALFSFSACLSAKAEDTTIDLEARKASVVNLEARIGQREARLNEVIATFRDEMKDKTAVVNADSYTWYGGSEANPKELAAKTARVLNADADEVVTESSPIKLAAY